MTMLANRAPLRRYHRPVLVDLALVDQFGPLRTEEGLLLTVRWGEPDAEGVFEPTFTTMADNRVLIDRDVLAELERRAGGRE